MRILICLSNVPDTTTKVKFKENNTALDKTGIQWIINPWDELALTRALELKESPNSAVSCYYFVEKLLEFNDIEFG